MSLFFNFARCLIQLSLIVSLAPLLASASNEAEEFYSDVVASEAAPVPDYSVSAQVVGDNQVELSWDVSDTKVDGLDTHYVEFIGVTSTAGLQKCTWTGGEQNLSKQDFCTSGIHTFADSSWVGKNYGVRICRNQAVCFSSVGCSAGGWHIDTFCGSVFYTSASDTSILNLPPMVSFEGGFYSANPGQTVNVNIQATDIDVLDVPNSSKAIDKVELYVTDEPGHMLSTLENPMTATSLSGGFYSFNVSVPNARDYYLIAVAYDGEGATAHTTSYIHVTSPDSNSPPSSVNNTTAIDFSDYQVQFGDIDGDGFRDMYFHGITKFVLLHGDVITPIALPTATGFAYYGNAEGGFGDAEPWDFTHEALEAKIASGDFVVASGSQRVEGDINGDGNDDILVKSPDGSGSSLIIEGTEGSALPQVLVEILQSGQTKVPGQSASELPQFANNLHDQALTLSSAGLTLAGRTLSLSVLQTPSSEGANVARNDNIDTLDLPSLPQPTLTGAQIAEIDNLVAAGGSFRVNEMGAATYSIPISLPQGTAGVTPSVSVNYSSQSSLGNMGLGWQLAAGGSISRCGQTLHTDGVSRPIAFDNGDRLCLDGQRLLVVSGSYWADGSTYRTEIDSDVVVVLSKPNSAYSFRAYRKDGSVSLYGTGNNSERYGFPHDSADPKVISWNIKSFKDSVGNEVVYKYSIDESYYRLSEISYANGKVSVYFDYGEKEKTFNQWIGAFRFNDNSLLSGIRVIDNSELLRNYVFNFNEDVSTFDADKFDRLTSVELCQGERCSLPTTFEWGQALPRTDLAGITSSSYSAENKKPSIYGATEVIDASIGSSYQYITHTPLDFNGDGIPDLAVMYAGSDKYYIGFHKQSADGSYQNAGGLHLDNQNPDPKKVPGMLPVDLNADGRSDLAVYNPATEKWGVTFSQPESWNLSDSHDYTFLPDGLPEVIQFADLNGDGLADLLYSTQTHFLAQYLKRVESDDSHAKAYGYDLTTAGNAADADVAVAHEGLNLRYFGGITDLNRDGKADIVALSTPVDWDTTTYYYNSTPYTFFLYDVQVRFTKLLSTEDDSYQLVSEDIPGASKQGSVPCGDPSCFRLEDHMGLIAPQLMDLNDDGLTDVAYAFTSTVNSNTPEFSSVRFRLGNADLSFSAETPYTIPSSENDVQSLQLIDWKQDGKVDLVLNRKDDQKTYVTWASSDFGTQVNSITGTDSDRVSQIGDFNGDGALDLSVVDKSTPEDIKISIAQGVYRSNNQIVSFNSPIGASTKVQYEPLNRSGAYTRMNVATESVYVTDRCALYKNIDNGETYLGPNRPPISGDIVCVEWEPYYATSIDASDFYTEINNPFGHEDPASSLYARKNGESVNPSKNGPALEIYNGMPIVTAVGGSAPTVTNNSALAVVEYKYEGLKIQAGGRGALGFKALTTIDRQTGIETETRYRQDWPFMGMPKKTTIKTATGQLISESSTTMRILGLDEDSINDPNDGAKVTVESGGTKALGPLVVFHQASTELKYDVDPAHLLMPSEQSGSPQTSDNWLTKVVVYNNVDEFNNNILSVVETYSSDGNGNPVPQESKNTTSVYYVDNESYPWSEASDKRLGRLKQSTVTINRPNASQLSSIVRTANFTYYGYGCNGSAVLRGLLCSEQVTVSDTRHSKAPATTQHFYDEFGNKTYTKTGSRLSAYSQYDDDGRYVDKTFGLFSVESYEQDNRPAGSYNAESAVSVLTSEVIARSAHGVPLLTRSYLGNGNYSYTKAAVSPLGVAYFKGGSNGAWEQSYNTRVGASAHPDACPAHTSTVSVTMAAGGAKSGSCFDKAGQQIGTFKQSFDGSYVRNETRYDTLGRAIEVSEPSETTPALFSATRYDVLGRPLTMIHPNLVTSSTGTESSSNVRTDISYNGLSVTTTTSGVQGGSDRVKFEEKDVFGQLRAVTEQGSRTAEYFYDVQGNLVTLKDPAGNESTLIYNGLGQKIEMSDPDKGNWKYHYNEYGELIRQIDAEQQTTVIEYDFKGRKLASKTFTGNINSSEPELTQHWEYDTAANGLGQVARARDYSVQGDGSKAWTTKQFVYDDLGRAEQTITTLQGPNGQERFYQKKLFDELGRPKQSFDAARIGPQFQYNGITNVYNSFGYLEEVVDAANDGESIYKVIDMDARGNVTEMLYGDGNTLSYHFNNRSGALEHIRRTGPLASGEKVYSAKWDHLGNLVERSEDLLGNKIETFKYDQFNRLTKNTLDGTPVDIEYDDFTDNIRRKSDVEGNSLYKYDGTTVHGVKSIGSNRVLGYDANGNVTNDGDKTISYSVKDQALQISTATHTTNFSYALGARYKRVDIGSNGTTTTLYVGNVEKVYNADGSIVWKRNVGGKAQIMHTQNASGLSAGTRNYFYHDHLGSVVAITNESGNVIQRMAYDPWGKRRKIENGEWQQAAMSEASVLQTFAKIAKPITNAGFTGHEMLDEVDIVHMNGRIYDASLGRFLQADPYVQAPTMIASLNRYSYLMNNPLNGTDPSGYFSLRDEIDNFADNFAKFAVGGFFHTDWFKSAFRSAARAIGPEASMFLVSVGSMFCPGPAAAVCASIGTYNVSRAFGATKEQAFKAGAISGGTTLAFQQIGAAGVEGDWSLPTKALAHGTVGGVSSVLQGGKFGHGFASAGLTKLFNVNGFMDGNGPGWDIGRTVVAGLIGGTISERTGGKFVNGAITAAMGQAFNGNRERKVAQKELNADLVDKYNALKARVTKDLALVEGAVPTLSTEELALIVDYEVGRIKLIDPLLTSYVSNMAGGGHISPADTFFRAFGSSAFFIEGIGTVRAHHINYIGIGMMSAHYGAGAEYMVDGWVIGWNSTQATGRYFFGNGNWRPDMADIPYGQHWASKGIQYYENH